MNFIGLNFSLGGNCISNALNFLPRNEKVCKNEDSLSIVLLSILSLFIWVKYLLSFIEKLKSRGVVLLQFKTVFLSGIW